MRARIAFAGAALSVTALLGGAGTAVAEGNAELIEKADRILALPVEKFETTEHAPPFDWTTDGCSGPAKVAPYRELFTPACHLHDFGYRNYGSHTHGLSLDPTPGRKKEIDDRFRQEMRRLCDEHRPDPIRHTACYGAAQIFYDAVRVGGDSSFYA